MERRIGFQTPQSTVGSDGGWFSETFKAYALVRSSSSNQQWMEMAAQPSEEGGLSLTYHPPVTIKNPVSVSGGQIQIYTTGETVYSCRLDMRVSPGDYIRIVIEGDLARLLKKIHDLSQGE